MSNLTTVTFYICQFQPKLTGGTNFCQTAIDIFTLKFFSECSSATHFGRALPVKIAVWLDVPLDLFETYVSLPSALLISSVRSTGFTQNNNENLNQLIWKISPKSVSVTSTVVEIAEHVAASTFNEGHFNPLAFLNETEISTGPNAHEWALAADELRITRANQQAAHATEKGRIQRKQEQKDALDILDESISLYGPGIDDYMISRFWLPNVAKNKKYPAILHGEICHLWNEFWYFISDNPVRSYAIHRKITFFQDACGDLLPTALLSIFFIQNCFKHSSNVELSHRI